MRPLVAIAQSATQVLVIRLSDRVGKGIRNSPRDALIADSVDPAIRGRAFGFNRTGDHTGGVVGPLIAFALVQWRHVALRTVFWWAVLPGALAVATVLFGVTEVPRHAASQSTTNERQPATSRLADDSGLSSASSSSSRSATRRTRFFFCARSSSAYRSRSRRFSGRFCTSSSRCRARRAARCRIGSDGSRCSLPAGSSTRSCTSRSVAPPQHWHAWALFGVYGIFFGLTEGTERALVTDMVPVNAARHRVRVVQPDDRTRRLAGVDRLRRTVGHARLARRVRFRRYDSRSLQRSESQ